MFDFINKLVLAASFANKESADYLRANTELGRWLFRSEKRINLDKVQRLVNEDYDIRFIRRHPECVKAARQPDVCKGDVVIINHNGAEFEFEYRLE
ncbi:hypothetical protein PHOBOS_177 [Erwinia phage vB_EamM_Phobos]|uniref:hypothetical protein n=1 Tax=Erwinia phage vB_EamM_Phobos TaxID=1883377 RepID=UPI00081CA63A|nr:hypothetical protein BIZ79_gp177 [Erwinia phage vB_EamM_Phobos]ANZ50367.1 hypothetical protein PHOBOS_177 [Erwinia phage vB_EamM_Phobos]